MTSSEGCNLEPRPDLGHLLGVCRESARPKNQKKQWARYNLTISPEYWLNVPLRFKVFGSQLLFGIRGTAVRCSWFFSWSCLRFKPSVAELRFSLFEYRHAEIQHSYLGSNKSRICTTVIPKQDRHLNTVIIEIVNREPLLSPLSTTCIHTVQGSLVEVTFGSSMLCVVPTVTASNSRICA